jgi:hypothetical protein
MSVILKFSREVSDRSREVLKNKKIKKRKDVSRTSEDIELRKVSGETCPLTQRQASASVAAAASLLTSSSLDRDSSVVIEGNVIPARSSSRLTGITAQHAKTAKGVKIMLTIQGPDHASQGIVVPVTAELKRYDRLREIKSLATDSDEFDRLLTKILDQIYENKDKSYCVGRIHERGRRAAWIKDSVVIGVLNDGVITNVVLFVNNEQYEIIMDKDMSERQHKHYHSQGMLGEIVNGEQAPTLDTIATRSWR